MESFMEEFNHLKIQLEELKSATNNFNETNVIGRGGFGKVYKGEVNHHMGKSLVAIKRLDPQFGQGNTEFWKEIMMLTRYSHENLISLIGFCDEAGEKILVYELALNGSLDRHLSCTFLSWIQRIKICLDAATGLCYLHDDKGHQDRVLHRDIKSSNILLDVNWKAKIADMGLSKKGPANQPHTAFMTNAVGTIGYLDPVYLDSNILTKKSDTYSFGVVLFEVLYGRLCYENNNDGFRSLVHDWKNSYNNNDNFQYPPLTQPMDSGCLKIFSDIAFQCLHEDRKQRPEMSRVVKELKTALRLQEEFVSIQTEYNHILTEAGVSSSSFESTEELIKLLSKGVFLNQGNKRFKLNHNNEHYEMISIVSCLTFQDGDYQSRVKEGYYRTNGKKFETCVQTQYLSPQVAYNVNLVYKFKDRQNSSAPAEYLPLEYILEGETNVNTVYLQHKSEDEYMIAKLNLITTNGSTVDLKFTFQDHTSCNGLYIAGIEFQPLINEEHQRALQLKYEEILKTVLSPLNYRFTEEHKLRLFKGVLLNGGKTLLSMNDKEELMQLISIKECLITDRQGDDGDRYSTNSGSSFSVGTYNTCGESFKTRVTTKIFSPFITYTANLIFKRPHEVNHKYGKQQYISIVYELNGEKKISMVRVADKREDAWLTMRFHQFNTSDQTTLDLQFLFHSHEHRLQIEGIKLQPLALEINHKYEEIVKSAEPPLFYTTLHHLKLILSKGIHLNSGKKWFHLNDKGQHCEMISIKECLTQDVEESYPYVSEYNSRFVVGTCFALDFMFKIRVRAQFLTPSIAYSVNLVFKFYNDGNRTKQPNIILKYKIQGQTNTLFSYLAYKREDDWWMAELCHMTSQGTTADLEIIFEDNHPYIVVDGIEFLPVQLEKEDHQVMEDENMDDDTQQPISSNSDSVDTYWEQKLPNDYLDIIKLAKHSVPMNTTKNELYLILSEGFLINDGQEWLSLDKNGKKCLMLSPRTALKVTEHANISWQSLPESRFGEMVKLYLLYFELDISIKHQVLESETTYATYLVYKLPPDQSKFETLVKVMDGKEFGSVVDWEKADFWNVVFVSPQIPVNATRNIDENTHNQLNRRLKIKGIPQQRSDGWMEVQISELQTPLSVTGNQTIHVRLKLKMYNNWFDAVSIQGIEFRPIYVG